MHAKLNRPGGRKRRNPGRPAANAQHAALSKESIVAKGLELCRGVALQELSVVRMARELGVTPALIHYYLGGREALTSGVMNAYYRELAEALPQPSSDWQADVAAVMRMIYDKQVKYAGIAAYVMTHNRYRLFQEVAPGETDYGVVYFDRLSGRVRQAGLNASSTAMFVHLLLQHVLASAYQQTSRANITRSCSRAWSMSTRASAPICTSCLKHSPASTAAPHSKPASRCCSMASQRPGRRAARKEPVGSSLGVARDYFAAAGNAGSLPMSRRSCWMMTVALRFPAIFFTRSSEATVAARS